MVTKFDSASLVDQGSPLHPAVIEFARGVDGVSPVADVIETAQHITEAALAGTVEPEISVDEDGALSLDLRLSNGLRMLAELPIDGSLDVGIYDDRDSGQRAWEVEYLSNATADDLIALL